MIVTIIALIACAFGVWLLFALAYHAFALLAAFGELLLLPFRAVFELVLWLFKSDDPVDDHIDAGNDVINVGKVSFHVAVIVHVDGLVLDCSIGKLKQRHVGSAVRTINSKESQAYRVRDS